MLFHLLPLLVRMHDRMTHWQLLSQTNPKSHQLHSSQLIPVPEHGLCSEAPLPRGHHLPDPPPQPSGEQIAEQEDP